LVLILSINVVLGKIWQNFNLKNMPLTYTKDFSLKKRNPNFPDFKEKKSKFPDFYHKLQEVAKNIERLWFFSTFISSF
jgi:hypothetical protein